MEGAAIWNPTGLVDMRLAVPFVLVASVVVRAAEPDPKGLAVPADQTAKAKAAVVRLDDDDIDVRDQASKELVGMGRLALPTLRAALKAKPSNEVQIRIEKLLPAARKDDFTARYPVFVADQDRKYDHDLPGWNELKAAAGDTPETRKLFANILAKKERRNVLLGAFDTDAAGRKAFEGHWTRKWQNRYADVPANRRDEYYTGYTTVRESVEYLAAGLVADLVYDRDYWEQSSHYTMVKELLKVKDREAILAGKGEYKDALTRLTVRWVETRTDPRTVRDAEQICVQMKLGEGLRRQCLERSCEIAVAGGPLMAGTLGHLAQTGDRKYIATVRQFFHDESDLTAGLTGDKLPEVQQRDVALVYAILLSGQKPKDYGFDLQLDKDDLKYYDLNYRFLTEKGRTATEKRAAAFQKWAEWEKANPDAIRADPPKEKK